LHFEHDYSAMQRIQAWSVAKNVALANPLVGAGFDFAGAQNPSRWVDYADFLGPWHNTPRAAHSIYFQILGQHGFVGLILFMMLLLGTFFRLRHLGRLERQQDVAWIGRYAKAIQFALIPYMISGAFLSLAYFDLFYACAAFSTVLYREATALAPDKVAALARWPRGPISRVQRDALGRPISMDQEADDTGRRDAADGLASRSKS
ncbi:MAG: O-antigen ligase family protein, partial [Gammaproteobacteria bacterium]